MIPGLGLAVTLMERRICCKWPLEKPKEETGIEKMKAVKDEPCSLEIITVDGHIKKRCVRSVSLTSQSDLSIRGR